MTCKRPSFSVGDLVFFVGNQVQDVWAEVLQVDRPTPKSVWVHYIKAATTYAESPESLVPSVWTFGGPMPAKWRRFTG